MTERDRAHPAPRRGAGNSRRDVLAALAGAAASPMLGQRAARAQQPAGMRRIAMLLNGPEGDPVMQKFMAAFEAPLRALGWIENKNLHIDRRWSAGNPELTKRYAPELVALSPDVIVTLSSSNLKAVQQATRSIPIVFALVSDPVAQGFVPNLTHPGGNITGFSAYESSMGGKWVDLLKQLSPGLARVTLMFNPDVSLQSKQFMTSIETAAPLLGVAAGAAPVRSVADIEAAVATLAQSSDAGVIIPTDQFLSVHRQMLIELLARNRIPALYAQQEFIASGGLIFYGTDQAEQVRKSAIYVDRILKGAAPGNLPVQNPTKFLCVINLKTAHALGIEVPLGLLLTADEVIE
jgi:putative ABC transport system substrate-binding protein